MSDRECGIGHARFLVPLVRVMSLMTFLQKRCSRALNNTMMLLLNYNQEDHSCIHLLLCVLKTEYPKIYEFH